VTIPLEGRHLRLPRWRVVAAIVSASGALVALILAGWIAVHTRFDFTASSGRHHAIRHVTPVSLAAWLFLMGLATAVGRSRREQALEGAGAAIRRHGTVLAAVLSIAVAAVGTFCGAFTAAGADPYGYVSQSRLWADGNPVQALPAIALDAPVDAFAFCPLGYRPGVVAGTRVPTYAPGLPLQMAALMRIVGSSAGYLVVPLLSGFAVWFAYAITRRLAPPSAALLAALCVACSPVFVFQMMQPMSDVPVTAWWLAAVTLVLSGSNASILVSGLAASMAILTRPNTVPLILSLLLFLCLRDDATARTAGRRILLCLTGCVPGIALVAATNQVFYGSPVSSGYGPLGGIYQSGGAFGTAWRYLTWLWDTQSILVFLPFLMPVLAVVRPGVARSVQRFGWGALGFFGVNLACYVLYLRFEHWTYLRFLLPAIPLLVIAATALLSQALGPASLTARAAVLSLVALIAPFAYIHTAAKGDAFALKGGFRHIYEDAAAFAEARLPGNAVFLGLGQTGSLNYYARRLTVRFELIEPDQIEKLAVYFRSHGLTPYAALERQEIAEFNRRFAHTALAAAANRAPVALPPDGAVVFLPLGADR
jgi:hypothetical protein